MNTENRKSFSSIKNKKGLNTSEKIRKYLMGKKVIILNTKDGHNYGQIGDIFEITQGNFTTTSIAGATPGGNNIKHSQFSVIETLTKEDLKEEIKTLQNEKKILDVNIKSYKAKLEFLEESKSETFDEEEYKAYKVVSLMEDTSLSKLEKVRSVLELIK